MKHVYTKPGTYNVVLTVKDAAGLSSVDSFMVSVRGTPIPSLKIR
ncbi:MAG: PKD domain-containing protein [Candidatus Omnitrophica bacterium]|nr:PKD domain-containing protein [Candidatus Omnitrophota bacterium]